MNNRNSSLIWVSLGSGLILSLAVLLCSPAYGEYRRENADMPLPAVFFLAMQDGVYPWTAAEPASKPASEPVSPMGISPERGSGQPAASGRITEEQTAEGQTAEGQVPKEQSAEERSAEEQLTEKQAVSGQSSARNLTEVCGEKYDGESDAAAELLTGPGTETLPQIQAEKAAAAEKTETENTAAAGGTASAVPGFRTADTAYFEDACFIGDSFTEGLYCYAQIPKADFYGYQGVNTYSIWKHTFKLPGGGEGKLEQALGQKQYGKIYILLGINELGSTAPEAFAAHYGEIIGRIRALQPEAVIFIQSIFHTTQKKSSGSQFKNSIIDANNAELRKLADNKTVFFLDLNPLFDDETGALNSGYSGDGVHIRASHYVTWRDFLLQHAIIRDTDSSAPGERNETGSTVPVG